MTAASSGAMGSLLLTKLSPGSLQAAASMKKVSWREARRCTREGREITGENPADEPDYQTTWFEK
jgi:hypothetical protein